MKKTFLTKFFYFALPIAASSLSLNAFADNKALYDFKWLDEGEKVYVVQNKEYLKTGRVSVDLNLMTSDASAYQETLGYGGAITYYFSENYSLDFTYKIYNNDDNADLDNIRNIDTGGGGTIKPLIRKIDSAKLLHFNWIPFYGKINTFNRIFFFDWGLGLGVGQFETQGNYKTFNDRNVPLTYEKSNDMGMNIRSYFKFFTMSNMTFGFEYNLTGVQTIRSPDGSEDILWYTDIMASIGYMF